MQECRVDDPLTGKLNPDPNDGFTSFDHIGLSFLTIFQCISLEGWVDVMYLTFQAQSYYSVFYFILLVLFGAWFVINIVVAVIHEAYERKFREMQRGIIKSKVHSTRKFVEDDEH